MSLQSAIQRLQSNKDDNVTTAVEIIDAEDDKSREVVVEMTVMTAEGKVVIEVEIEVDLVVIEVETEAETIGIAPNVTTITSLGETPAIVAQQNDRRMPEEEADVATTVEIVEADVATTVEIVEVDVIIEVATEVDVATTVEIVEADVIIEVAIATVSVVIEEEHVTGATEMVEQRRNIIERSKSRIIRSTRKEMIDSQRVRPHSEQYFSPRLSSLFMEYFLHSGHGGNPVFSFFTLRNLRGIGNRGHPFFGLRTLGIAFPLP